MNIFQYSIKSQKSHYETGLLTTLSTVYYLDRHETLSLAIQYFEICKALSYGIVEFKAIYSAYVKQGGAK